MTPKLAFGIAIPKVAISPTGGERGKDSGSEAFRFEDALVDGKAKRKPNDASPARPIQSAWRLEGYGTKLKPETAVGFDTAHLPATDEAMSAEEPAAADTPAVLVVDEPASPKHVSVSPERAHDAPAVSDQPADGKISPAPFVTGMADSRAASAPTVEDAPDAGNAGAKLGSSDPSASAGSDASGITQRVAPEAAKPVSMETGALASNVSPEIRQPRTSENSRRQADGPDRRSEAQASRRTAPEVPQRNLSETTERSLLDIRLRQATDAPQPRENAIDQGARRAPSGASADAILSTVNVLGSSGAVAPAQQPSLGITSAGLVTAMADDASWRQAATETPLPSERRGFSATAPVNTLRIQLNPAELGMVTARLTASGSQLSIEIQVESNDARQRLTSDSDAILKALRAIGYDVEKVTIQQAPTQGGQAQGQPNGGPREQFQADQQGRQDAGTRGQNGEARQGNEGGRHGHGDAVAERAGSGVYI